MQCLINQLFSWNSGNYIKNYSIAILVTLFFATFISLILTFLNINNLLDHKYGLIVANITSYIFFAISSYILGIKMGRHGLIHGIVLSLIMMVISIILFGYVYTTANILKLSMKSLVIIFFAILGVNKKNS